MKKIYLLTITLLSLGVLVNSQTKEFAPGGKPIIKVFNNFHTTFSDGASVSAFEVNRFYLGYEYAFSQHFSAQATLDIGDPGAGNLEMTAYLKKAYLKYKADNLTVYLGMISTTQFKVQEGIWGYRYLRKSFQDEYKFNASADLGVNLAYKFTDFLSADVIVSNGEGYKTLQTDSILRTGLGVTITPLKKWSGRVYYDFTAKDETQSSLALFIGYEADNFSLGAEYNQQFNVDFVKDRKLSGPSFYGTYKAAPKVALFARYDQLFSNTIAGQSHDWNLPKDGKAIVAGLEYAPVKGVRLAPNIQTWSPENSNQPGSTTFFINCEFTF